MGRTGYPPGCFSKSVQTVWIERVVDIRKMGVWKLLNRLELRRGVDSAEVRLCVTGEGGGGSDAISRPIVARCLPNVNSYYVVRMVKARVRIRFVAIGAHKLEFTSEFGRHVMNGKTGALRRRQLVIVAGALLACGGFVFAGVGQAAAEAGSEGGGYGEGGVCGGGCG